MVTYVLGAGASLHAGYPLTTELGDRLHAWAQQTGFTWGGLIDELNELYGGLTDLEKILTELNDRPEGSRAATLSQTHCGSIIGALNVAIPELFYNLCQNPFQGRDLYQELARCKLENDDTIITFNYDMACERALKVEGKWEIGDGYGFSLGVAITPPSKTKLLKLHGSTNWLGILFDGHKGSSTATNVYGPRPCLFGERYFTYLGYSKDVRDPQCRHVSNPGGDPALILPALQKNFFNQTTFGNEWEPFWDDIWGQAEQALQSCEKIVIIGYSMPAADERARELLLRHSNPNAEILVFSGSKTDDICEEFRKSRFQTVNSFGDRLFEDYLNG